MTFGYWEASEKNQKEIQRLIDNCFIAYCTGAKDFDNDLRRLFAATLPNQNITPIDNVAKVVKRSRV